MLRYALNTLNHYVRRGEMLRLFDCPNNYPVINHIDEDKSNNSADNLEWCTIGYNNEYGNRINQNKKPVMQLSLEGKPIRLWESAIECERVNGYSKGNISRCCNGVKYYKTYKGYRWAWG